MTILDRADVKDRILAAIPIESYIGRFVTLKKAGRSLTGLCPFHSEKSPSFHVTPEKGLYHCFGCQKGGNLFTFVMDHEGLSFNEALETLARYAGIEIQKDHSKGGRQEALYDINERVAKAFQSFLAGGEGGVFRDYAASRKIGQPIMDDFRIGAAPERWQWLEAAVGAGSTDRPKLLELGLIRPGKDQPYDFFRGR
ncbi:MAG: DNA primase, partial [Spirochaetia bacterium]|nr:DNA primase [Spirochaetia bacterium]